MFWFRRSIAAAIAAAAMAWISIAAAGLYLSEPVHRAVTPPPPGLAVETVTIPSTSGSALAGWFVPARPRAGSSHTGAVVLLHGWTSTRGSMLARVQFLHDAGYAVLAFDFQSHGESAGERITFGRLEALDAEAATAWMKARLPDEKVGVIGVSLGGAAAVLEPGGFHGDALVLESVFPDINRAVGDRLTRYVGPLGSFIANLFVATVAPIIHMRDGELHPIDHIGAVAAPVLVIGGTGDRLTRIEETREMFAAAREPKQLWEVEGAGHVDLERFARPEYHRRILDFFGRYLRAESGSGVGTAPFRR